MFKTITTSPSNWRDNNFPEGALVEIQAELNKLTLLGKTDGIQLRLKNTTELGGDVPLQSIGSYRTSRVWATKEIAEQWIVFIISLHTKYSLTPLSEAEITEIS